MNESKPKSVMGLLRTKFTFGKQVNVTCQPALTSVPQVYSWNDTRSGSDLPNWRVLVSQGLDATTNFSASRRVYTDVGDDGYAYVERKLANTATCQSWKQEWWGNLIGFPTTYSTPVLDETSALNMAKRRLIQQVVSLKRPIMGLEILGELHKTLHMIRNPALELRKAIDSYFSELKKVPTKMSSQSRRKALIQTYLEATYGWTPLISDIQSGVQLLRQHQIRSPSSVKKIVTYGSAEASSLGGSVISSNGLFSFIYNDNVKSRVSFRISAGLLLEASGSPYSLPESLGVLPRDFLPTAWELLPYSFLIDYFTNIGTIIDAWSYVNGRLAFCSLTKRRVDSVSRDGCRWNMPYVNTFGPLDRIQLRPVRPAFKVKTVGRTKLVNVTPDFAFRLPGFGTKTSLNIAALAYQGLVRRPFY